MNKNDLKNGMTLILRGEGEKYIVKNKIFGEDKDGCMLELYSDLKTWLQTFDDDLKKINRIDKHSDIMKVLDCDNKVIWERKEIDWTKVPVDTKVLVRNFKEEWVKRYFAEYKDGMFYAFNNGGTSWSTSNKTSWGVSNKTSWRECKLAEEPKEEITVSVKDLYKAFKTMCDLHNCDCCDYDDNYETCEFRWISDNYNITKK